MLLTNLLQLVENISDLDLVKNRFIIDDAHFCYNFEKHDSLIQFELKGDTLLTSAKPLSPVTDQTTSDLDLPDIFPIKPTITLNEENIYEIRGIYRKFIYEGCSKSYLPKLFSFFFTFFYSLLY